MAYTIILAGSTREASKYAKLAGLPKGRWRFASQAASIRGLRVAEIHELPSFARRPDRHAINGELRYTKGERIQVEMPEEPVVDQGDGMGEQLTIDDAIAEAYAEEQHGSETGTPEPVQEAAPAPAPVVESPAAERKKRKPAPQAKAKKPELTVDNFLDA